MKPDQLNKDMILNHFYSHGIKFSKDYTVDKEELPQEPVINLSILTYNKTHNSKVSLVKDNLLFRALWLIIYNLILNIEAMSKILDNLQDKSRISITNLNSLINKELIVNLKLLVNNIEPLEPLYFKISDSNK